MAVPPGVAHWLIDTSSASMRTVLLGPASMAPGAALIVGEDEG